MSFSAAISKPDVIVADEPTSKLDEQNRIRVWRLLYEIAEELKIPIICATHDGEMTDRIADRIVRLKDGCVVENIVKKKTWETPIYWRNKVFF